MNSHSHIIILVSGVALFMYGTLLVSDFLQKLTVNRTKELLAKLSKSRLLSVSVGVVLSTLMQSSGAVTTMLVGLGSAGVIQLQQVMGVIIGSAVGSTVTVQLISFRVAELGLPIFTLAFATQFISKSRVIKNITGVMMGFGLIFFGLEMMGWASSSLKEMQILKEFFLILREQPVWALIFSSLFTAFVHSSAVTIGLAMTLAQSGLINLNDAMYWIYGANIGTTATALLAAIGGNFIGRQVAWAHFLYKAGSVIIFLLFNSYFVRFIEPISLNVERDIANGHTIFNVAAAILFFPFIQVGAKLTQKLFPPRKDEKEFSTKFLRWESSPQLAYAQATRETMRMGDIVIGMLKDVPRLFEIEDFDLVKNLKERDNKVDLLHHEIKFFLVRFLDNNPSLAPLSVYVISLVKDLENAADIIDRSLINLAEKKHRLKLSFSSEGRSEILEQHRRVLELAEKSLTSFQIQDVRLAEENILAKREIYKIDRKYHESHIERLSKGLQESINTSSIHLDVLADLRRFASLTVNHCYILRNKHGENWVLPSVADQSEDL